MEKFWKCIICGFSGDGDALRVHYSRCRVAEKRTQEAAHSPDTSTISNEHSDAVSPSSLHQNLTPTLNSPLSYDAETRLAREELQEESWLYSHSRSLDGVNDLTVALRAQSGPQSEGVEAAALESVFTSPTTVRNSSHTSLTTENEVVVMETLTPQSVNGPIQLPVDHSPSTIQVDSPFQPPHQQTAPESIHPDEGENDLEENSESPSQKAGNFFSLWENVFLSCDTLEDLNSSLGRCSVDWLEKAATKQQPKGQRRPRQEDSPSTPRRRRQARQLQRIRQKRKYNSEEASRIQRLFNLYPRRAVRQILGEKSLPFTGTTQEAQEHLRRTYILPPPSPNQCIRARRLYDACGWAAPSEDQSGYLNFPPSREEIEIKLKRATNTSPGLDGIEYRHIRSLDPHGRLLEVIYRKVWQLGIPDAWKRSRTASIYKKGDTSDFSNFRPISLLSTLYKIYSGIISQRLTSVAVELGWLSPEQKGFLPGVHGIQEHTELLQTAVEETTSKRRNMSVAWLDLCNAFGSVPHTVLLELFHSLPLPDDLKRTLSDIYAGNIMDFVVGNETISIAPLAGVRQGDALSTTIFNLAAEPLLRAATSDNNSGINLFGHTVKATAYADDIAVLSTSAPALQKTLDHLSRVAVCACLNFHKGATFTADLLIEEKSIRCLGPEDQEIYLGTPIGAKLQFRIPDEIVRHLDKIAQSLLAPRQKLEVFRIHLLPSLSHHLASGRVLKEGLATLDIECRKFLAHVTNVPLTATVPFYYADRRVGGLGMFSLTDDADVWTLARAVQLLTSNDETVRSIFKEQLNNTILRAFPKHPPATLPIAEYLSGSNEAGLYRLRYGEAGTNLWTLARRAAKRLDARIDISDDETYRIIADDVSVIPAKAVRGLRQVVRQKHTAEFTRKKHQGRVAIALAMDTTSKDIARLTSCRTELRHADWKYIHMSRLDILPLCGYSYLKNPVKLCRRCGEGIENGYHVFNNCRFNLNLATARHDAILELLANLLTRRRFAATVNKAIPGQRLRPDVELQVSGSRLMIDVAVSYDIEENLEAAYNRKVTKYQHLGRVLPLVVGSLGSWYPPNDNIRSLLAIDGRSWATFRRKARVAAIQGSMSIIRDHLKIKPQTEEENSEE